MASCDTEFRREIIANKKEQELNVGVELIERHVEQLPKCNFVYNSSLGLGRAEIRRFLKVLKVLK